MKRPQLVIFGFIGVVVVIAIGLLTGIIPGLKESEPPPFTLTIWGTNDSPDVWREIATAYRTNGVSSATVAYVKKDSSIYERELVNALASGSGPDIFFLPDDWIEKHLDKVLTLPDGTLNYQRKNLKAMFADYLAEAIVNNAGDLIGTPLAFDTLGLFFNRDAFNAANIPNPPITWDEFVADVEKLTTLSEVGGIESSGAAIGTASNIAHASDIFASLLYQNDAGFIRTDTKRSGLDDSKVNQTLAFYTSFSNITKKTYSWNGVFESSLDAFAKGDTAMAFGYASDVQRIVAVNPQLNFDSAKLPQLINAPRQVNFGRFSVLAVSRATKQSEQSWSFLLWLQDKSIQKTYDDLVGLPPARRDLVTSKTPRDYLAPFYDQVLSARVFPPLFADSLQSIVDDMIDSVVNHRFTIEQSIQRAHARLNAIVDEQKNSQSPRP